MPRTASVTKPVAKRPGRPAAAPATRKSAVATKATKTTKTTKAAMAKPARGTAARATASKAPAAKTTSRAAAAKAPARSTAKNVSAKATASARPAAKRGVAERPKPNMLVRDSFTMPKNEYEVLAKVKKACVAHGMEVKKSQLLRVGIALIRDSSIEKLKASLAALPLVKAGRPKKEA